MVAVEIPPLGHGIVTVLLEEVSFHFSGNFTKGMIHNLVVNNFTEYFPYQKGQFDHLLASFFIKDKQCIIWTHPEGQHFFATLSKTPFEIKFSFKE